MNNSNRIPKFYLNPVSGRVIKSSGKTYAELKKHGYTVKKERCLYNVKSAKKCLVKLLTIYKNDIYPPSNFTDIPKTFKSGKIRGFITNKNKDYIIGYIDKKGKIYKLKNYVKNPKNIPTILDSSNTLIDIVETTKPITQKMQDMCKTVHFHQIPNPSKVSFSWLKP